MGALIAEGSGVCHPRRKALRESITLTQPQPHDLMAFRSKYG